MQKATFSNVDLLVLTKVLDKFNISHNKRKITVHCTTGKLKLACRA